MLFPLPLIPNYTGRRQSEYIPPTGIYARWPSGATAPVEKDSYWYSLQRLAAKHPDAYGSRRKIYDTWLADGGIQKQTVLFSTKPPGGTLSLDGTNFASGTVTGTWAFTYSDFMNTSKSVTVHAQWPSGAKTQIATIPISTRDHLRDRQQPYDERVEIPHPSPSSKQYEYDALGTTGYRSSWDTSNPRWIGVTFQSSPRGASIYSGGKLMGKEPILLGSEFTYDDYVRGYVQWQVTAVWESQAEKVELVTTSIRPNVSSQPRTNFVFHRPNIKTGMDTDTLVEKRITWNESYAKSPPESHLWVKSDPEGATLYIDGNNVGQAPTRLSWSFTESEYISGMSKSVPITARWPSGATSSFTHSIPMNTTNSYSYVRPSNHPNNEIDVNYALEYAGLREIKRQQESRELSMWLERQRQDRMEAEARSRESTRLLQEQTDRLREQTERERYRQQDLARQRAEEQRLRDEANRRREYESQQLLLQQRMAAETERANRAREQAERNAQTMQSLQMLNQSIQNMNSSTYRSPYSPYSGSSYEIRPKTIDLIPNDGINDAGTYFNPYVIERK